MTKINRLKQLKNLIRRSPTGQVGLESEVGRWIALISSLESVKNIVEIGTWRGNGTTLCIAKGLKMRNQNNARLLGLELVRELSDEAAKRHANNPHIRILWGRVVDVSTFDDADLTVEEEKWLKSDIEAANLAPEIMAKLPSVIDLLVLDGGEFSTHAEFHALKGRVSNWIILDDTRLRKCKAILQEIMDGEVSDFEIVDHCDERNGTAVLRRCTSKATL